MTSFATNCARCSAQGASFSVVAHHQHPVSFYSWYAMAYCGVCSEVSLFLLATNSKSNGPTSLANENILTILDALPTLSEPRVPKNIPASVIVPLVEAEKAFAQGLFSAAGSCYRKAMERATKQIDPSLKGMLNSRIRTLEKQASLPKSMIELLDQIRLFGNESMHEDDRDPSREDCEVAREFANLFLIYAFEMPHLITEAKDKAASHE